MGDVRHVGVGVRQDVVVTSSLPVADAARPASGAVLEAVLDRVTYANEETGYTIAGVSTSLAVRIYKKYGDASISVVRNEPYRLAADVWGIGFKTADTIAQAVGIPHDSPQRVQAGIQYTLSEAADNGHCYLPEPNLIADAAEILKVPAEQEQAVRLALTSKVAVLTGGPGCGKSFTVKSIITLAAAKRAKIVLAAPTGRAAKRLTELSGYPATTVHRLLQLRPGGDPSFDRDNPLDADLVVVD